MIEKLKSIFNVYSSESSVEVINNNSELYLVKCSVFENPIVVCAKALTFGGRENLAYEQRVQIKGISNNYAYDKLMNGEKAILLGLVYDDNIDDTIICAWKLKHSTASNTLSKQIKNQVMQQAIQQGFAYQSKGNGEFAYAFRKEFLYFYIQNSNWLHNREIKEINEHLGAMDEYAICEDTNSNIEKERLTGGENVLLYGVPGTGKSYIIKKDYCSNEDYIERVVFHPDYTYSDFVGQILPRVDGGLKYVFTPGPFTKMLKKAENDPTHKYCLIIEEINRGNAPAIFGEIFQLLDRKDEDGGYPASEIGESEYGISNYDVAVEVYKDENHQVKIPSNLSIIATMNTSDQNIFTLDTAFQRRWDMRHIKNDVFAATHAKEKIEGTDVSWGAFALVINEMVIENSIDMVSSDDKRLGAYFVKKKDLVSNKFAEKVLKYLWDDAFKMEKDLVFKEGYKSLESIIMAYESSTGDRLSTVLKLGVYEKMLAKTQSIQEAVEE